MEPSGHPESVLTRIKNDTFTTTSSSFVDLTGMSRTITPSVASSKILILTTKKMILFQGGGRIEFTKE